MNSPSRRVQRIQEKIRSFDYICSGTLIERTKVCGKARCRCAQDPDQRHGPYHEWSRRKGGRLVHSVIPKDVAKKIARAIRNHKTILVLLADWERETARALIARKIRKPRT